MPARIQFDREKLAEFCRKQKITGLWLFGSVIRDDFKDEDDIDVLYEFDPSAVVSFFTLPAIEEELSNILAGRHVHFVSRKYFGSSSSRDEVLHSAEVLYAM